MMGIVMVLIMMTVMLTRMMLVMTLMASMVIMIELTMTTMMPWQVHPAFYSRSCRAHWMAARVSVQV